MMIDDLDAVCACCEHTRRMHWLRGEADDVTEPEHRPSLAVCAECRLAAKHALDQTGFHQFVPK